MRNDAAWVRMIGVLLTVWAISACSEDDRMNAGEPAGDAGSATLADGATSNPGSEDGAMSTNPARRVMVQNVPCTSIDIRLPTGWPETLEAAGFTKCVAPFGVVIGAQASVPDSYIDLVARIVAELLDPDMDGFANDPGVRSQLANGRNVWIPMPVDEAAWIGGEEASLGTALDSYGIMIPAWWLGGFQATPDTQARAVMVEEVVHAFTQFGYALEYPEIFGVSSWDSLIAREAQRAQCMWWQHPENSCPGSPSMGGDCSEPSCDVTEFYQQVLVLRAGMTPAWFGIGFPRDRDMLNMLLSDEVEQAMDNPMYNQLRQPLTFTYGM